MAISEARGLSNSEIRCPSCRAIRRVDQRQARRWREGHIEGTCIQCRGRSATRKARDRDFRFWLGLHGVQLPRGVKAIDHIVASGMPESLREFARNCYPDP